MKKLVLILLLTLPLVAQQTTVLRFDPPDPTNETGVHAHIHIPIFGCGATGATVTRSGSIIGISLIQSTVLCLVAAPADITVDLGLVPAGVYGVVVSPGQLLSGLAEAELDVRDAKPPFTVLPNTRSAAGGGVVRLVSNGADFTGVTSVHFGTTAAEVLSVSADEIRVREPAVPGTYDVIVDKLPAPLRATAAYHVPGLIRNAAFYERVLFPVFWSGGGAFGALWQSRATLYNGNLDAVTPPDPSIFTNLAAGATSVAIADDSRPNGVLEILPRQANANVDLGLIVHDLTHGALDTQIPVIRESQLYARPFSIADVPFSSRSRLTLRLYDVDGPTTFVMRAFNGPLLMLPPTAIVLNADAALKNGGVVVINDLAASYPELRNQGSLRIEIDPLIRSGARAAWGFISMTNNDTQHVTILSPQ